MPARHPCGRLLLHCLHATEAVKGAQLGPRFVGEGRVRARVLRRRIGARPVSGRPLRADLGCLHSASAARKVAILLQRNQPVPGGRPEACAACAVACDAVGQLGTLCYERMGAASVCDDLVSSATKKPPVSL
jgi:hypothetical protein